MPRYLASTDTGWRWSFRRRPPDGIAAPTVAALVLLTLLGGCIPDVTAESNSRPNIVFIFADDK